MPAPRLRPPPRGLRAGAGCRSPAAGSGPSTGGCRACGSWRRRLRQPSRPTAPPAARSRCWPAFSTAKTSPRIASTLIASPARSPRTDPIPRHQEHTIGRRDDLLELRGYEDDRVPCIRQLADRGQHLLLGPHVDTARRLVDQEDERRRITATSRAGPSAGFPPRGSPRPYRAGLHKPTCSRGCSEPFMLRVLRNMPRFATFCRSVIVTLS